MNYSFKISSITNRATEAFLAEGSFGQQPCLSCTGVEEHEHMEANLLVPEDTAFISSIPVSIDASYQHNNKNADRQLFSLYSRYVVLYL